MIIKDIANDTPMRVIHKDSVDTFGECSQPSSKAPNLSCTRIRGLLFSPYTEI